MIDLLLFVATILGIASVISGVLFYLLIIKLTEGGGNEKEKEKE